jgi:hypothetical protein
MIENNHDKILNKTVDLIKNLNKKNFLFIFR